MTVESVMTDESAVTPWVADRKSSGSAVAHSFLDVDWIAAMVGLGILSLRIV